MRIITATCIILSMFFFSCKKEETKSYNIRVKCSRGYIIVNNQMYITPHTFDWNVGNKYHITSLGSYSLDLVSVTIYKNGNHDLHYSNMGGIDIIYEVQP